MDRITAINESIATFVCGVFSLIPAVGILPAIYALANWRHLRAHCVIDWNPAEHYLRWGVILAIIGIAYTCIVGAAIVLFIIARRYG